MTIIIPIISGLFITGMFHVLLFIIFEIIKLLIKAPIKFTYFKYSKWEETFIHACYAMIGISFGYSLYDYFNQNERNSFFPFIVFLLLGIFIGILRIICYFKKFLNENKKL